MACYEETINNCNWGNAKIPKMVSIRKAAEETGLTYVLIRELCDTGRIAYLRSGRKYLVNFDSLLELLHNGERGNVKYDR